MSSLPSVSEGIGQGVGLLGGYASSNYQNYLGNTIKQVLTGNQFKNVFGTGLHTFLDIARIWQKSDYNTTPFSFDDTPTSLAWKKWNDRLGYLGIGLGVIDPKKDEKTGKTPWAGWTSLNVGDISTLNYKGNLVRVNRAVCQINYSTIKDLPLQIEYVEAKVHSYFWWIWGVGIASMVVFQLYNTKVSQNQEVQEKIDGNMTWKMINIAMELVQFLVLKKMASFQQDWTAEIMELEINAASTLKLDDSEIVVTLDKLKSLEKDLLSKVKGASDEVNRLQKLSGAAVQSISKAANESALALAKHQAAQDAQFAALVKANRQVMQEALIAGGIAPEIVEEQLLDMTALTSLAQEEADLSEKSVTSAQEKIEKEQNESIEIANLATAQENCDTTVSNASTGAVLNQSLADNVDVSMAISTTMSKDSQIRSEQASALAARLSVVVDKFTENGQHRCGEIGEETLNLRESMAAQDDGDAGQGTFWGNLKRRFLYGDPTKKRSYGPTIFGR